jgi:hypothetical protein
MRSVHKTEPIHDPAEDAFEPQPDYASLAQSFQASLGSSKTFGFTEQSHEHEYHLNDPWSLLQAEDTIWKGDAGFLSLVDCSAAGIYESFRRDDKGLFPYTSREFASQGFEPSFEGNQDGTRPRVDTTKKLIHSQDSHAPPGPVDATPVLSETLQASDYRKPGTVIPCPLKQHDGCSGKDENMASLE